MYIIGEYLHHEEKITSLGTYDVSVKLQKDISAKFHIDVVEAK